MKVGEFFSIVYDSFRQSFKQRFSWGIDKFQYGDLIQRLEVICYAVAFPFLCSWWFLYYTVRWMLFSAVFFLVLGAMLFPSITTEVFSGASAATGKDWIFLIIQWFVFNFIAVLVGWMFGWVDVAPAPWPGTPGTASISATRHGPGSLEKL